MFIVLEGTDASGKSSLFEEICTRLSKKYPEKTIHKFHQGRPLVETRRWTLEEYAISISTQDWSQRIAVADRWHWGEVTYAPLKRPNTCKDKFGLLGVAGWRWVELFLLSRGVSQFWLYQPLEVIQNRLLSRGDTFVSADELESILKNYEFGAESAADLAGILRPRAESFELVPQLADHVISVSEARAAAAAKLSRHHGYIGPVRPSVLLVGDKRNDPTVTVLPFMPVDSNSGDYLMSALPDPFWKTVGIINGADVYGHELHELWDTIGNPPIIALGRMAERSLKNSGLNDMHYRVVPHPQYVRRFHHQDRFEYGRAIESLALATERIHDNWILP